MSEAEELTDQIDRLFTENQELYGLLRRARDLIMEYEEDDSLNYGGAPETPDVVREIDAKLTCVNEEDWCKVANFGGLPD